MKEPVDLRTFFEETLDEYAESLRTEEGVETDVRIVLRRVAAETWKLAWRDWHSRMGDRWIRFPHRNIREAIEGGNE